VWQKAMILARDIYQVTRAFPREEIYGLTSQLRRAAVSVPSNIAEGHVRLSDNSFRLFLSQARGSLFEVETQLQLAADLNYCNPEDHSRLVIACDEIARMTNGLLTKLGKDAQC